MAGDGVEAVMAEFARGREEHLGHIIGLAAVIASIPGVETVQIDKARSLIDGMMLQFVGAKSDTRQAARSIVKTVLSAATLRRGH
jgi:hypothetical protein